MSIVTVVIRYVAGMKIPVIAVSTGYIETVPVGDKNYVNFACVEQIEWFSTNNVG